ncbi:hypothetical protein F5Y04DRAFT_242871 [Hypomontagnella monticulosa]|nr:hypothetical protein F5Y04DRAFT_242871 [Hypomontagnella monticulosa]
MHAMPLFTQPLGRRADATTEGERDCTCKRKRDDVDNEDAFGGPVYYGRYVELDENNIMRGIHADPFGTQGLEPALEAQKLLLENSKTLGHSSTMNYPPRIQWRGHGEVAIEVDKYKQALALHDLVDESNAHVMVVDKDRAIVQGHCGQAMDVVTKIWESWGNVDQKRMLVSISAVSGGYGKRQRKGRQGGLVDIHYGYMSMDWKKAEELMGKEFHDEPGGVLAVIELRPDDSSPPGKLKPGRRLVRYEDL